MEWIVETEALEEIEDGIWVSGIWRGTKQLIRCRYCRYWGTPNEHGFT